MFALLPLLAVLAPTAQADELTLEASLQGMADGGAATGLGARLSNDRVFFSVDGRVGAGGAAPELCREPLEDRWWIGRATGGLDLFASEHVDLTLGLFVGTAGGWTPDLLRASATGGFEFGIGANLRHLSLRYRHADGLGGPLEARLSEDEWRVGATFFDHIEIFGQYVRFDPGDRIARGGAGVGAGFTF